MVLALWKHRHELPNGKRPFEDFEPIFRAIESLDPDNDTPRYFRAVRDPIDKTEESPECRKWLELADGLDYSAKLLIRYCLEQASQDALDKSQEWVKLTEANGLEDRIEFPVIRFVTAEGELANESGTDERQRKLLEDRINRLNVFKNLADELASELRQNLSVEGQEVTNAFQYHNIDAFLRSLPVVRRRWNIPALRSVSAAR